MIQEFTVHLRFKRHFNTVQRIFGKLISAHGKVKLASGEHSE